MLRIYSKWEYSIRIHLTGCIGKPGNTAKFFKYHKETDQKRDQNTQNVFLQQANVAFHYPKVLVLLQANFLLINKKPLLIDHSIRTLYH